MKPLFLSLLPALLLGACAAPKAILLAAPGQAPAEARPPEDSPPAVVDNPGPEPLPMDPGDGLLEPKRLGSLPTEREMRPTVDPDSDAPVIARPPTNE